MSISKRIKDVVRAVVAGTPTFQEKPTGAHDIAPIEQRKVDLKGGGTLADPREQQRIAPHHRVVVGMGSGGPEDVNTYALYDRLPQAEKDAIRARSTLGKRADRGIIRGTADEIGHKLSAQAEMGAVPIGAGSIVDAFDAHYIRDPRTKQMKLRPNPECKHENAKKRSDGYAECPTCRGLIEPTKV